MDDFSSQSHVPLNQHHPDGQPPYALPFSPPQPVIPKTTASPLSCCISGFSNLTKYHSNFSYNSTHQENDTKMAGASVAF
jgi:hypothetical protein